MEETPAPPLITGQAVAEAKILLARQMRRAMTPTEVMLWQRLRRCQLGHNFRRQQIIKGFIADFYCNPARLAVEVDGSLHDAAYDAARDRVFQQQGVRVLRFTADEVEQRIGFVLARINSHLETVPQSAEGP